MSFIILVSTDKISFPCVLTMTNASIVSSEIMHEKRKRKVGEHKELSNRKLEVSEKRGNN